MQNCHSVKCECRCECKCDQDLVLRIIEKVLDHRMECHHEHHHEKGEVSLGAGRHELFIRTKHQPQRVFLCAHACHQVCGSGVDLFASQPADHGFVLVADVKNDSVLVEWMVVHGDPCC